MFKEQREDSGHGGQQTRTQARRQAGEGGRGQITWPLVGHLRAFCFFAECRARLLVIRHTERCNQTKFLSYWLLCGSWIEVEEEQKWTICFAKSYRTLMEAWPGVKISEMGKVGRYQ